MTATPSSNEESNVVGAVIFFSYIAAALVLIGVILYDLWTFHNAQTNPSQRGRNVRTAPTLPLASTVFALFSFSALSYHMLCFLLVSYSSWAHDNKIPCPKSLIGDNSIVGLTGTRTDLFIWKWATSSNLFQDFAEAICIRPSSYFWTQKALLYSFAWNTYMAEKGTSSHVPRLWAYFALDQILPISFAQNLFGIACQVRRYHPQLQQQRQHKGRELRSWIFLTACYVGCLIAAPRTVGGPYFVPCLFATRLLLLSPLLLKWITTSSNSQIEEKTETSRTKPGDFEIEFALHRTQRIVIALATLILEVALPWKPNSMREVIDGLNDNYAVKALGYDFLIGVGSLVTGLVT